MVTISSSWNAEDVIYYSEGGGSKWDDRSLHLRLSGEDVPELPVRVEIHSGSEIVSREHYEWHVVDTTNRFMDTESRTDTGYKFTGNHKTDDPHYFFFDGMVIDIHPKRTFTKQDSAFVTIIIGCWRIKSPSFLSEKSRDSRRKRLEATRKKALPPLANNPAKKEKGRHSKR